MADPGWLCPDKRWSLFLDRDGVINERLPGDYVKSPSSFVFIPGAAEAIARLSKVYGWIFIVTNQQGIGRGLMSDADLKMVHDHMLAEIGNGGGSIHAVYYCPHRAEDGCACRKPATGMFDKAVAQFPEIDGVRSVMVGDSLSDMLFARNAGMHCVAAGGNEEAERLADAGVADLNAFADIILEQKNKQIL